jgi:hypothetical protein
MKRYSQEEKGKWLEDWQVSGKSAWAYAKANGLNPQTFIKWAAKPVQSQSFVEIRAPQQENDELLIERGEVKIHIPLGINEAVLLKVVQSLSGL